jgi:hypothetical protein
VAKTIAIHQPEYFPPVRFFHKVASADTLVFLTGAGIMFDRSSLQHRAKIAFRTGGTKWLTIPYRHRGRLQQIEEVEPSSDLWAIQHLRVLRESYGKSEHWETARLGIEKTFNVWAQAPPARMVAIAAMSVCFTLSWLLGERAPRIIWGEDLGLTWPIDVRPTASERLARISQAVGADVYLSGRTGSMLLKIEPFRDAGVTLRIDEYKAPPEDIRELSILHAICSQPRETVARWVAP